VKQSPALELHLLDHHDRYPVYHTIPRASEVEEPEVIPDAGKPAKSVRTITTNGGESSEGEDDDDEDEEEEEPYV
jgi:hypothetical protein